MARIAQPGVLACRIRESDLDAYGIGGAMGQSPRNTCEIVVGNELFPKVGAIGRGAFWGFARRPVREVYMTFPVSLLSKNPPLALNSPCTIRIRTAHGSGPSIEAVERRIPVGTRGSRG